MGMQKVLKHPSGVFFEGSWADCYKANLRSRIATRIILPVQDFPAYKPEDLYNNILKHDFTKYIPVTGTIAVDAHVRDCGAFRDQRFVAMKVKDAVVDQFREKFEVRPNVDSEKPDLRIIVRAVKNQFSVAIDTSGDSLFKRGYRVGATTEAHLKEHVAAGLLRMAGYKGDMPVVDPMCGSGTLLVEAALIALRIAPGLNRKSFGFQRLNNFQKEVWEDIVSEALAEELEELPFKMYGYDLDKHALKSAQDNARGADVDEFIEFARQPMETLTAPTETGIVVVDPPYGERMGDKHQLFDAYKDLAHTFKVGFKGWDCFVLSGSSELSAAMKLKAERKFPVFNGPIECRFLRYKMR
jgi:23S rRNA G2445 N2-methylase RlmL